jgi:phage tail tape-measure protein
MEDKQISEPVNVSLTEEELEMSPERRRMLDHKDGIQHGIDDNPENDAAKGAGLGAIGGGIVGGIAGALLGPAGVVVGALSGAAAGAVSSGLAVAVVDSVDNDDNVTGVGAEVTIDPDETLPEGVNERIRLEKTGL